MNKQARFSDDGKHRFWLLRSWEDNPKMLLIIGLNPSTADGIEDDPTIRSCIRLTKQLGFGGFVMCNLFTFITPDPKILLQNIEDANRRESHETLKRMLYNTGLTVCAWGSWKGFVNHRAEVVKSLVKERSPYQTVYCFGVNMDGSPKHPLYLKTETALIEF